MRNGTITVPGGSLSPHLLDRSQQQLARRPADSDAIDGYRGQARVEGG